MLALLGGTFDPFHLGHLYLATAATKHFNGAVTIIPNATTPHRNAALASWQHRLAMCQLAVLDCPQIRVVAEETPQRSGRTIDTLISLRQQYPTTPLSLIIGSDVYRNFGSWQQPSEILKQAHLIVVTRPETTTLATFPWGKIVADKTALAHGAGGVYVWQCAPPAISATHCRAVIAGGGSIEHLVPEKVAAYIRQHGLYRSS